MKTLKEITRYPSAVAGLVIILVLVAVALYAVITIPYSEAVRLWRGGAEVWYDHPKTAQPIWMNLLTGANLPPTLIMSSQDGSAITSTTVVSEDRTDITISFPFDYSYDGFPQELSVFFTSQYSEKQPLVFLAWLTPDGREIRIGDTSIHPSDTYRISQDAKLKRRLGGELPEIGLFADPAAEALVPLKGAYELRISGLVFEEDADIDAEFVLYGQVHGLAGTDHRRRDLRVALLYGTPIALAFGLLAAVGTTITTMAISGIGAWYGRWVDMLIQRITEVNLILPFYSTLIMIGTFYSRSIWLMLGVVILLSIFGSGIKTYRAVFLQVKESPYVEAAQAYGASDRRIIFRYLIPRLVPMLLPQLVTLVPLFVFIEASLSVLGLGDPVMPTWGKVIAEARRNGALYEGDYYWMLEPAVLLALTGLGFSLLGFSLDRVFNPRLRGL
jgi:peptide/nickel transport system permease protein